MSDVKKKYHWTEADEEHLKNALSQHMQPEKIRGALFPNISKHAFKTHLQQLKENIMASTPVLTFAATPIPLGIISFSSFPLFCLHLCSFFILTLFFFSSDHYLVTDLFHKLTGTNPILSSSQWIVYNDKSDDEEENSKKL